MFPSSDAPTPIVPAVYEVEDGRFANRGPDFVALRTCTSTFQDFILEYVDGLNMFLGSYDRLSDFWAALTSMVLQA
jgi:hypothetical protein